MAILGVETLPDDFTVQNLLPLLREARELGTKYNLAGREAFAHGAIALPMGDQRSAARAIAMLEQGYNVRCQVFPLEQPGRGLLRIGTGADSPAIIIVEDKALPVGLSSKGITTRNTASLRDEAIALGNDKLAATSLAAAAGAATRALGDLGQRIWGQRPPNTYAPLVEPQPAPAATAPATAAAPPKAVASPDPNAPFYNQAGLRINPANGSITTLDGQQVTALAFGNRFYLVGQPEGEPPTHLGAGADRREVAGYFTFKSDPRFSMADNQLCLNTLSTFDRMGKLLREGKQPLPEGRTLAHRADGSVVKLNVTPTAALKAVYAPAKGAGTSPNLAARRAPGS